ncbi:MAG: hypothetical protein WCC59_07855, partial [Terriglobales bacterium]
MQEFSFLLFREGRLVEASEVIKKILELNPAAPGMDKLLGLSYLWSGRPGDAVAPLERASTGSADRLWLARAYFETCASDKGMQALEPELKGTNALQQAG